MVLQQEDKCANCGKVLHWHAVVSELTDWSGINIPMHSVGANNIEEVDKDTDNETKKYVVAVTCPHCNNENKFNAKA
ncbi:MAG: hypothetical protein PWP31_1991 [Clostridia bacterium]|nr:hypothetical protein [Clostridia bacterium]